MVILSKAYKRVGSMMHNGDRGRGVIGVIDVTNLMVNILFLSVSFFKLMMFLQYVVFCFNLNLHSDNIAILKFCILDNFINKRIIVMCCIISPCSLK